MMLWHCEHENEQGVTDYQVRVRATTEVGAESLATSLARSSVDLGAQVKPDEGEWRCYGVEG